VERELVTLIILEINLLLRLEQIKKEFDAPNIKLRHCFKAIDDEGLSWIDNKSLQRFMIKMN